MQSIADRELVYERTYFEYSDNRLNNLSYVEKQEKRRSVVVDSDNASTYLRGLVFISSR